MAGDKVCDDMTVLLQNDTLWIPTAHGAESMVNFENIGGGDAVKEEFGDDDFDLGINRKKRRLSASQVQYLEKHFEVENKLEPERKSQLAMELGLQQRQVAIWFQNRRARSKTKQLQKDYDSLKSSYDKLKLDYDILLKEKENLNNQFVALKEKVSKGEEKVENVEKDVKEAMVCVKQVDGSMSSGKSDVLDSDSPQSYLDPVESGRLFESEFSQDEGDGFSRSLFSQQPANFEFSGEDQPFWCWGF